MSGPLNAARPTTSQPVAATYNTTTPAPVPQQACALQCDNEGNLLVNVVMGGGSGNASVGPTGSPVPSDATYIGAETPGGVLAGLQVDADGYLEVNVVTGGGSNGSVSATGSAVPADATYVGAYTPGGNLAGLLVDADGYLEVNVVTGGGSNASIGTIGVTAPTSATQVGGTNPSGNLEPLQLDQYGNLEVVSAPGPNGSGIPVFVMPSIEFKSFLILCYNEMRAMRRMMSHMLSETGDMRFADFDPQKEESQDDVIDF